MKISSCCILEQRSKQDNTRADTQAKTLLQKQLQEQLELLIEQGVRHFISGFAPGLESDAARLLLMHKEQEPSITLECVIAHEQQHICWSLRQQDAYFDLVAYCDYETMLQTQYSPQALARRDRYLIRHSDCALFLCEGNQTPLTELTRYAYAFNKQVISLPVGSEMQEMYLRLIK